MATQTRQQFGGNTGVAEAAHHDRLDLAANLAGLVVLAAQVAVVTHLVAAVSVTFLRHSSAVVQVDLVPVNKQGHLVVKI